MSKRIAITKENREYIAKAFGVTDRMVFKALAFQSNTDLAKRIRVLAMKRGGYNIVVGSDFETFYDYDDYIRQYFPNGVMLEMNKLSGSCDVFKDGENVKHWDNVMVSEIRAIQNWAMAL